MTYQQFAGLYDRLMEDAPYDMWLSFVTNAIESYSDSPASSILDIGCGTGEISIRLAKQGLKVQGIDLSEEMLTVAKGKADREGLDIRFFQQDMRDLDGFSEQDVAVIFCDSLNYLRTKEDVRTTFERISKSLKQEGILLFDVHSLYKVNEVYQEHTFALNDEQISYIWECHQGDEEGSVHHELTFFTHLNDTVYQRHDESHYQITYSEDTYWRLLDETGFEVLSVTADFSSEKPHETSERLFFVAKKRV